MTVRIVIVFFFFNDTATTEIYTLSLHDALPICGSAFPAFVGAGLRVSEVVARTTAASGIDSGYARRFWNQSRRQQWFEQRDRKSTRLNSSHLVISYAVFCLKKKNLTDISITPVS